MCGIQNGIVKDDLLAAAFGSERVVGAVTIAGVQREPDGRVACTSPGATFLGELSDQPSARVEAAAAALNEAGLPTTAVTNVRTVLWSKMCNAAGLFAVTCLSKVSSNRLGHYPDLVRAYMGLIREVAAVAAAQGIPMADYPGFPIKSYLSKRDQEIVAYFQERAAPSPSRPAFPSRAPRCCRTCWPAARSRSTRSTPTWSRAPPASASRPRASPSPANSSARSIRHGSPRLSTVLPDYVPP